MNELSALFCHIKSGDTVCLSAGKTYTIAPEDSFQPTGLFFSNTAKRDENPHGDRFCGIYIENKENIVIDGNGATVLLHGIMTPFIFKNCRHIVMKNLTFDHIRPTMSECTVTGSTPGEADLRIQDEFLYKIDDDVLYWISEPDFNGVPYWTNRYKGPYILSNAFHPDTRIIDDMQCGKGDTRGGVPDITKITETGKGQLHIHFRDTEKVIPVGTVIQTRNIRRIQTGGAIDGCTDVTLENLRIQSMNCFGILAQNSRDLLYKNLDCTPKEGRTVVSDADFFHFSGCSGSVTIRDCKARGAHDDIINIHGTHLKIITADRNDNSVLLRYSHPESWGFNPYLPGDTIEFVSGNTLLSYFSTKVTAVMQCTPTDFRIRTEALPDRIPTENDVIENTARTASLTVENCCFECIPSRAILCTTRKDVVIRNTVFRNLGACVICVADDANFWFESGRSGHILFENNTVENVGARETGRGCDVVRYEPVIMDSTSEIPVHQSITIRNNTFLRCPGKEYTIRLRSVGSATITGNRSDCPINITNDDYTEIRT